MGDPVENTVRKKGLAVAMENLMGSKNFTWAAFLSVIFVSLLINWFTDGITKLIWEGSDKGLVQFYISSILLAGICFFLREVSFSCSIKVRSECPEPARCLVVFLSTMEEKKRTEVIECPEKVLEGKGKDGKNWRMPYEAIKHHSKKLDYVYVVTSESDTGSAVQFSHFREFINKSDFGGNTFKVKHLTSNGINFENIDACFNAIEKCYEKAVNSDKLSEDDVIVDITGGQKTTSIAGALSTLYKDRKCQYVSTDGSYKISSYDVKYFGEE